MSTIGLPSAWPIRGPRWKVASFFRVLIALPAAAMCGSAAVAAEPPQNAVQDLGIPVRSVNWVRLHCGHDGNKRASLLATMGQDAAPLFVLRIDPQTGVTRQFVAPVAKANFPTATLWSRTGRLYIGAAYAGHLLCFDPAREVLEDLGAIHAGAATFPCRLDEDDQGRIWIGSYPAADLTCYDPAARQFTRYGRMDDVDMYNYCWVDRDGRVANLIRMTRPHVVLFDPGTRTKKNVGPLTTKGQETLDLMRGTDGALYIVSSVGHFRIQDGQAVAVDQVPAHEAAPTFDDGTEAAFADGDEQIYRRLTVRGADGTAHSFALDYEAAGNNIFCLHAGPDGGVYGSSYLPLHLFRYTPSGDQLLDLGKCSSAAGEAYSMANLDGRIYISSYSGARVSVYDPRRPYAYGTRPDSNPRDLGSIDEISYRPRATLAGPLGRVWLASIPDYGRWGGPLSYYDPQTDVRKAYYRIVGDASCYTLAHLADQQLLAIGTSISGGSGTRPKVKQAQLVLWDYRAERLVWEGTLAQPVSAINALVVVPSGKLIGTFRGPDRTSGLFVFDPVRRVFAQTVALPDPNPVDLGLQMSPRGRVLGFTASCIYELDPDSMAVRVLCRPPTGIEVAGPLVDHRIYFSQGCHLYATDYEPREPAPAAAGDGSE